MQSIARLKTGKQDKKIEIVLLEPQADKKGFPLILNDEFNGNELPSKYARVHLRGNDNSKFFVIHGPIRELDADGIPVTRARQREGQYIDKHGMPTNEGLAARENVYVKNSLTNSVVYSDLGTINIENKKTDGKPTKFTVARVKLYSESEALLIAKLNYMLADTSKKIEGTSTDAEKRSLENEKNSIEADIKDIMKNSGTSYTMFINSGAEFLKDVGFEIRTRESQESSLGI